MRKNSIFSLGKVSIKWILLIIISNYLMFFTTILIIDRIAYIINLLQLHLFDQDLIFNAFIIMVFALIGRLLLSYISNKSYFRASARIKLSIREKIYSKLLNLELKFKDIKKTGEIVATIIEGVESLEVFFGKFFPQLFLSILIPISLYFYLVNFSYIISLSLILFVVFIPISILGVRAWVNRVAKIHWETYEDLNRFYLDSLQGITTLKLYGLIKRRIKDISDKSWDFRNKTMKVLYSNLVSILVMDLIAYIGTAVGIILSINELVNGLINLRGAIIILFVSYEFFRPLRQLGSYFHIAMGGISASKSILEILNIEINNKIKNSHKFKLKNNIDIEFQNVSFSYDKNGPQILKCINFKIKSGQTIAIVGESGSGKTTIINLIAKFYEPNSGEILIGGQDIRNIPSNEIRELLSIVSQHTFLFHGTIRENLLIAKNNVTDEELYNACKKAEIIDFINSLPKKLDSPLMEQAKNLSGGQIQRIAIARAILKDAPILILDEALSNVDAENEEKILHTLKKLSKSKTTIIISHRLSTIRDVDKIFVLDNGVIIEEGTHKELMLKNGKYAELVRNQIRFEKDTN